MIALQIEVLKESVLVAFERLRKQELNKPAAFGLPFPQIKFLHGKDHGTRLTLSTSHALHDGISLSYIVDGLGSLYTGIVLPRSPSSADCMDHVDAYNEEAQGCWQDQLRSCSVLRGFGDLDASAVLDSPPTVLEKVVSVARLPCGITTASLFTSSCAIDLTKFIGDMQQDQDIVIGRVVSKRATAPVLVAGRGRPMY